MEILNSLPSKKVHATLVHNSGELEAYIVGGLEATDCLVFDILNQKFKVGILFTLEEDFTIQFSKKGKVSTRTAFPSFKNKPPETHDQPELGPARQRVNREHLLQQEVFEKHPSL